MIKRIRNLPSSEQRPFEQWLAGKGPRIPHEPDEEQDGYYESDYRRWLLLGKPTTLSKKRCYED